MNQEKQESWFKKANKWVDQAILDLAKPLMLIMFVGGTADVLTQGWLANQSWFAYSWAIIQALTIDGLFFAVWSRLFDAKWTRSNWPTITGLALIGIVLSLVVMSTNAILSFQQLWGVSTSQEAMLKLGIDARWFTFVRSVLVVVVTVMVAFVYHRSQGVSEQSERAHKVVSISERKRERAQKKSEQTVSTPTNERKFEVIDLIKQGAMDLRELAKETGVAYSTLTRWKREAQQQQTQQAPLQLQAQTD